MLTSRDFAIIFAEYRMKKGQRLSQSQFFASIAMFDKVLKKYDEDFVKFMLQWAMDNEDFYSPKYLFLLADKLKPVYREKLKEKMESIKPEYKEVDLPETKFKKEEKGIPDFMKNNLSSFD